MHYFMVATLFNALSELLHEAVVGHYRRAALAQVGPGIVQWNLRQTEVAALVPLVTDDCHGGDNGESGRMGGPPEYRASVPRPTPQRSSDSTL